MLTLLSSRLTHTRSPRRSSPHPASRRGTSCCLPGPGQCVCGGGQSRKTWRQELGYQGEPDKRRKNLKWMEETVSVTMTRPNIGKWHTSDQDGHTTPKDTFSSLVTSKKNPIPNAENQRPCNTRLLSCVEHASPNYLPMLTHVSVQSL